MALVSGQQLLIHFSSIYHKSFQPNYRIDCELSNNYTTVFI